MFSAKNKIDIDLSLSLDYAASKQTCYTVLEALLKYILCQRHLIPIQIDILSKEIRMEPSLENEEAPQMEDDALKELDTKTRIRKMVLERRKLTRKQSYLRRRIHWKTKVIKFLDKYALILQTVKEEMQNCRLKEVMFLLGASPYSAKEVYRVHLPQIYEAERTDEKTTYDRKTLRHMLRAFTESEGLSTLVNRRLPTSKLWVMVSKDSSGPSTDGAAHFVPKMEYAIPARANCVNVRILGQKPTTNMDLTPITHGTIYYISPMSRKELFAAPFPPRQSDVMYSTYPDLGVVPLTECPHLDDAEWLKRLTSTGTVSASCGAEPKMTPPLPEVLSRICDSPMQETPVADRRAAVTPSPIRALARGVKNIRVCRETPSEVWFQLAHSLAGFRDFWPVNPS